MAASISHTSAAADKLLAGQRGPDEIAQDMPRGFDRLGRVEGAFAGHAFAPANYAIDVHFDQQNAPLRGAAKARLKRRDERHLNFAERNLAQAHKSKESIRTD